MKKTNSDLIYMDIARSYAKFSKCISLSVGCIIVNESGRIVASGVNGSIPGAVNCCDHPFGERENHHSWSLDNEIHAEMNAILELASNSKVVGDLDFYVTHSPCNNCLKHILGLQRNGINIRRIIFGEYYYRTTELEKQEAKTLCSKMGIEYYEIRES